MNALTPETLAEHFRAADARMRDTPFHNDALDIEPVGFRDWEGHRLGVMIAPWFLNLVLLPGEDEDWRALRQGDQSDWHFPAETVRFTAGVTETGDVFLAAPAFNSVTDFPDQATARAVAEQLLTSLLAEPGSEDAPPGRTVSRRDIFRGKVRPREA